MEVAAGTANQHISRDVSETMTSQSQGSLETCFCNVSVSINNEKVSSRSENRMSWSRTQTSHLQIS